MASAGQKPVHYNGQIVLTVGITTRDEQLPLDPTSPWTPGHTHPPCASLSHPSTLFAASCTAHSFQDQGSCTQTNPPSRQCNNAENPPTARGVGRILPVPQGMGVSQKDRFPPSPSHPGTTSPGQGFKHSLGSSGRKRRRKRAVS